MLHYDLGIKSSAIREVYMFKPYDSSSLTSALRLYDLQYDLQPDSLKGFSETLQPLSFSGSTLINPVFSADASILDSAPSAPDMGAMAALFQSDPAIIFAQALFTAMVDNGHVFEAQSNGCACCGHDHGMNAKTQIMKLSNQIQQLLDSGLDISNFNTLIGSISALGDVDADIFANSLQETAEAFAKPYLVQPMSRPIAICRLIQARRAPSRLAARRQARADP